MKQATAQLRYLKMTPRKVRRLADLIKGLSVNEAEAQLISQSRRAAGPLLKLLRSALANAKEAKLNLANVSVKDMRVDQGPMVKRYLPRARGSASPIQRKMSHVHIILEETEVQSAPRFQIQPPKKKEKTERHSKKSEKPGLEKTAKAAAPSRERSGFMKKFFRRKSV